MTEREFLEIVSLHVSTYYKVNNRRYDYDKDTKGGYKKRLGKLLKDINLDDCLLTYWLSGGVTGGSCWNEDNHYPVEGEPEEQLTELDTLLEQICPNLTYLEYKKLLYGVTPELFEYGSWEKGEYYGNSYIYSYKMVVLRRLWERLQGLGVINDD